MLNTKSLRKLTDKQLTELKVKYLIELDKLKKRPRPDYEKLVNITLKNIRTVLKEREGK